MLLVPNISEHPCRAYWKRFESYGWFDTGDSGMIDQDGYVHVLSRADDLINVAGHRLSTSLLEQGEEVWLIIKEFAIDVSFHLLIPPK